jgi:3-phosphoshikimate 1-carboxyvinyltransferase
MRLIAPNNIQETTVEVPSSKSISNRLLIIQALSEPGLGNISNLSNAQDTIVLDQLLSEMPAVFDVGHAGTAFRFLTSYLSITKGEYILTGSDRMKQRPISPLVNALKALGAEIEYLEKDGFPPLKIRGKELVGGHVEIDSSISSQFITALMLIAPKLNRGLEIKLKGNQVSVPYLKMTAELMGQCGALVEFTDNVITISKSDYEFDSFEVEYDWSAASFWYELVVIGQVPLLHIANVKQESIQGDKRVLELFQLFGVESSFDETGLHLRYSKPKEFNCPRIVDFKETPDLVQPFLAMSAVIGFTIVISGTKNLQFKETNRAQAMKNELAKLGAFIDVADDSILMMEGVKHNLQTLINIETYQDHRMAMALAPLALVFGKLDIENPQVVEKSYPDFWEQLKKLGFIIGA